MMKNGKRILAALLAGMLALCMLTACSSSNSSSGDLAQKMGVSNKAKHLTALDTCADNYLTYKHTKEETGGVSYVEYNENIYNFTFKPLAGKSKTEADAALKASGTSKEYVVYPLTISVTNGGNKSAEQSLAKDIERFSKYQDVLEEAEYYGFYEGSRNFGTEKTYVVILVAIAK